MSDEMKREIRDHYGAAAAAARALAGDPLEETAPHLRQQAGDEQRRPQTGSCCGPASSSCCAPTASSCCGSPGSSSGASVLQADVLDVSQDLYDEEEVDGVPLEARLASLGCGNPVALAELREGETVLDLGSGGGIDVLLSARRVGPSGWAYGLDMTDEMLALARENQRAAGADNVEFLKGDIEAVPLPDASVDVIISNCVVNLATDKDKVFAEALRVLRPGGRFAVADMVFLGDVDAIPVGLRRQVEAWAACVAGALGETEYLERLAAAGFVDADVRVLTVYDTGGAAQLCGLSDLALPSDVQVASAFVSARKPGG